MAIVKSLKIPKILILIFFCFHFTVLSPAKERSENLFSFNLSQDSLKHDSTFQEQDSIHIRKDSLEELVPYLDDVEADTKNELLFLYMLAIILATWFSEDLACIGAGIMAANGLIDFWPASIAAVIGIYVGDFTLYFAGRFLGDAIFNVAPFKWIIKKENVEKSVEWFKYKGPVMLIVSRFIPGSRIPVYLSAGILRTGFWKFLLYFGVTTLLWTPLFVWISVFAGNEILTYYEAYDDYLIWIILGLILVLWAIFRFTRPLFTRRGRRILWRKIQSFFD